MARAQEAQPAGDRERALRDLVDAKFGNTTEFFREVAKRTKLEVASEKKAYYRIIEGLSGSKVKWRLRQYATVLGVNQATFIQAWEADEEAADESGLPLRLSPREVRDALVKLQAQVGRLERQVGHLEQQQQPRKQQAVKR